MKFDWENSQINLLDGMKLEANKSINYKIIFPCWRQRYKLGSGAQTWLEEECMRMMELDGIDGRQLTRGLDASNPPC